MASHNARFVEASVQSFRDFRTIEFCKMAQVVLHIDALKGLARLPIGLRDDHHTIVERHAGTVRGHALARMVIKGFQLAAECGTGLDGCIQHVGKRDVDTVSGAAVDLVRNIDAGPRGADYGVLSDRLERRVLRNRHVGCESGNAAE